MSIKTSRITTVFAVIALGATLAAPAAYADNQSALDKAEKKAAAFLNNAATQVETWSNSASKRIDKLKETGKELTNVNKKAEKHVATGTDQILNDLNDAGR